MSDGGGGIFPRVPRLLRMSSHGASRQILPIDEVLPEILAGFAAGRTVVIHAPPGAGKTTRVPLALLDAGWLATGKIVMLEPRRLAARAAARHMAMLLGEEVGATVGFRVRGETRVSATTRVEVVTEGILTRMLQRDATLAGIGVILFDEFHERSIHADVGLALTTRTRGVLRDDLRVGIMSATLDSSALQAVLDDVLVVASRGRAHAVEVRYLARRDGQRVEAAMAGVIRASVERNEGSVLAFLPGAAEIRRTADLLGESLAERADVMPLFGDLPPATQDRAIAPATRGRTKVVLATSIAETSLTIDGVRVVVDSGLARIPRFSARTGMARLETVRVSRASAEQRCGRAGRTAPGVCYRLWDVGDDAQLRQSNTPEILEGDLTALALDLALAGVTDVSELRWIDEPPAGAIALARALLRLLGAIDAAYVVTPHGEAMARFGMHPRLAHMILRGAAIGAGATACVVAALLDERDVLRRDPDHSDADLRTRVSLVADFRARDPQADDRLVRRVRDQAAAWSRLAHVDGEAVDPTRTGELVALAYPERVARRRQGSGSRFLMRGGSGSSLARDGTLARSEFLAVAELDGRLPESAIYLAAPLDASDVERLFSDQVEQGVTVGWDADSGSLVARQRRTLGALTLSEGRTRVDDDELAAHTLIDAIRRDDGVRLSWTDSAMSITHRVGFAATLGGQWPDLSMAALHGSMESWLAPHLGVARRREDVERLDVSALLLGMLSRTQRRALDHLAPTHVTVPTGSRIPVDYGALMAPSLSVRLQELFGLADTPRVGDGRVPLTLHLLSPAHRPVQVTRDLGGFWRSSYFAVRKDLRARYPRHAWPEDPMSAVPTKRAKPRS